MANCSENMMSTSEFDESVVLCSIWTKCDCSFCCWHFLMRKLQAPTTRLAAPLHQNKASCQKNIHNHILFICYTIHLIHQFLKCSSCSLDKTSSKLLFTVIMWGKMKCIDTTIVSTYFLKKGFVFKMHSAYIWTFIIVRLQG